MKEKEQKKKGLRLTVQFLVPLAAILASFP